MQLDSFLFLKMSSDRINELFKSFNTYFYVFLALIWTTILVVKLSFLAFFKKFIERVIKIQKKLLNRDDDHLDFVNILDDETSCFVLSF